jgi:short-subunit dehydrogenase
MNTPITHWHNRRVWLIGASSGIGLALAKALAVLGAHVIVSARNEAALIALAREYPQCQVLALDVTDAHAVQAAAHTIVAEQPLDLVCYCVGQYQPMRATAFDSNIAQQLTEVNLVGAYHVLNAVIPHMLANKQGHLSLVSSVAGYRGLPQSIAYGPAKAALINLAETLYIDLKPQGLDVSVINPGFVQTPMTDQNDFEMPALISAEEAAQHILQGWMRGEFEIHFPKRFTRWLKLLQLLPYRWYFGAIHRLTGL